MMAATPFYLAALARVDRLGFGSDIGIRAWPNLDPLPGHGPADVVLNANKNAFMVNVELFGWSCGSLLFVAYWLGRANRRDVPMAVLSAAVIAAYGAYWFAGGPDLGARYWYVLLVPLATLTARGIHALSSDLERRAVALAGGRVGAFVCAASIASAARRCNRSRRGCGISAYTASRIRSWGNA